MKIIHMTFKGNAHAITANKDGLFNLNDIAKAYDSINIPKVGDYTKALTEKMKGFFSLHKVQGRGKAQGTFMNERGCIWYASKLDEDFEIAMIEAFELLTKGKTQEAAKVATQVAISQSLIDSTKGLLAKLPKAFYEWNIKQPKPRGINLLMSNLVYIPVGCKASFIKKSKKEAGIDAMVRAGNGEHVQAINATCLMLLPMLEEGLDYYLIQRVLRPNHTTKPKRESKVQSVEFDTSNMEF